MKLYGSEEGFTLVETVLTSAVVVVVLLISSLSIVVLTRTSVGDVERGTSTGPALVAAQQTQEALAGAWNPAATLPSGYTEQCSQLGGSGENQTFPAGQGAFVSADATDLVFCGFLYGSKTAYTYELYFPSGSCGSGLCTLEFDRYAAPGPCSPCAKLVWATGYVSDTDTPFSYSYYDAASGDWTTTSAPTTSQLQDVESVDVTLLIDPPGTSETTVQRTVLLPNNLSGGS